MQYSKVIDHLKHLNNWHLFFLDFITFGIYSGFYVKRQAATINPYLDHPQRISMVLVNVVTILKIATVILGFVGLTGELPHLILFESDGFEFKVGGGNSVRFGITALLWIWSFQMRNRLHTLLNIRHGHYNRFSAVWTFFFPVLYFNYKINRLHEYMAKYPYEKSPTDLLV